MKRARPVVLAAALLAASAHVGSPDAWYDGVAGPYAVRIHVAVPQVIPGVAAVTVRTDDPGVALVTAVADHADATGGAPPPEVAEPVAGEPGAYRTGLWLMTTGSYSVTVAVSGARGRGTALVPVVAMPLRRLELRGGLALLLGALGLLLMFALLSIVAAAVREGVLAPGAEPDGARRRRARRAVAGAALALTVLLLAGWRWWRSEDAAFERGRFRPLATSATASEGAVVIAIEDSLWIRRHDADRPLRPGARLIPDHGKLMHLFLVAEDGGALAHLHPSTGDSVRFTAPLPPLPPGRYRVFADIVQESGFAQTLVAAVELPVGERPAANLPAADSGPAAPFDPDDSWAVAEAAPAPTGAPAPSIVLADGSAMTWLRGDAALAAGQEAPLRFRIEAPVAARGSGPVADALEPYMGMAGHAAVVRDDGLVFAHLHPGGSFSMAAQMRFLDAAHAAHRAMDAPAAAPSDTLAFPFAFPEPGHYRIWIQVKRAGRVLTGAFEASVEAGGSR